MNKTWLVARHEYLRTARKRSFLLGMFAIPVFFGVLILVAVVVSGSRDRIDRLGYVDEQGLFAAYHAAAASAGDRVPLALPDEGSARAALERGDIKAYCVISPDYLDTRAVSIYYLTDPPSPELRSDLAGYLRNAVTYGLPADERTRLAAGFDVTVRTPAGDTMESDGFINLIVPVIMGVLFMFAVLTTGGYLMMAVSDERENRTVEVLTTSLSPEQLIVGKSVGLMGAAVTQLLVWSATTAIALFAASRYVDELARLSAPTGLLVVGALFFLPSFALVSGLMTLVGSVIADTRQGQQLSAVMNMFFVFPLFFMTMILEAPNGPVAVALTLFPTSSMLTVALRWGVGTVPLWQLVLGFGLTTATAVGVVWLAPRVFRMGMMRYGQRLALRHLVAGLRAGGR